MNEFIGSLYYHEKVNGEDHETAVDNALMEAPFYEVTRSKGFASLAKGHGYDGIKALEWNKADDTLVNTWGVFEANQLKSATENSGEYSENPDIRYSVARPETPKRNVGESNIDYANRCK